MSLLSADAGAVLKQLVDVVEPVVYHIQSSVPTTQDHYGDYMSAITRIATMLGRKDKTTQVVVGVAMIRAGANAQGVKAALKVLGAL